MILSQNGPLRFELPASGRNIPSPPLVKRDPLEAPPIPSREDWKRQDLESIKQSGGKGFGPSGAAELLKMKPTTLASRIKALGLNRRPGA